MIEISMKVNETDLRKVTRAIDKVSRRSPKIAMDMQKKCAIEYYQLVAKNILSGKYRFVPYNERYADWKARNYGALPFWVLGGDLVRSLTVKRMDSRSFFGGVPQGIKDSGGKSYSGAGRSKEIAWYGKIAEEGGTFTTRSGKRQKHPPRPVFGPSRRDFANNKWKRQGDTALGEIKKIWR